MIGKPYDVGCGLHINPNGSDTRCGNMLPSVFMMNQPQIVLCDTCRAKQHANRLAQALKGLLVDL